MGIVRKQSIQNSIYFYIGLLFGALSTIVLYPNAFNSHPEHLGLLQIIVAYSTIISTFSFLGTPKTLIRFFPKVENKNQLISLSFLIPIIGFLFVVLLYFLFKEPFLDFIKPQSLETKEILTYNLLKENFHLVFLMVAFLSFFEVFSSLSRSLLNATIPIFLKEVFLKGMNILLLFLHWFNYIDFPLFLNLYISLYLIMTIILSISIFKTFNYTPTLVFTDLENKKLFLFGLYVLVGGASAMLVSKVDMMMIGKFIGYQEVAFYTVAFFIGNVIRVPARAIGSIATPLLAKAWERNDINEISRIYSKSSINQLIIGGLIFLGLWLNIDDGLSLLPEKFQGGRIVVLFIAFSQLFNITTGANGIIIVNSRYYKFDLYANFILLCITLYTNYLFIPDSSPLSKYDIVGINGAAFATALSVLIFNFIKLLYLYFKMKIQPFGIQTIKVIILILLTYYIVDLIPEINHVIYNIIFKSLVIFSLYILLIVLFKPSEDIIKFMKDLWSKFKRV